MRNRFRVYVGPTAVKESAQQLAAARFTDLVEGTEHVYATLPIDADAGTAIAVALGYQPLRVEMARTAP